MELQGGDLICQLTTRKRQVRSFLSSDLVLSPFSFTPQSPLTALLLVIQHYHLPMTGRQPMKGPYVFRPAAPPLTEGCGEWTMQDSSDQFHTSPKATDLIFQKPIFFCLPCSAQAAMESILLKLSKITSLWAEIKHAQLQAKGILRRL